MCTVGHIESEAQRIQDAKLLRDETARARMFGPQPAASVAGQPHEAHVGVIQLRAADVPDPGFPEEYDLFQSLWCPQDHLNHSSSQCRVYWRQTTTISSVLKEIPVPSAFDPHYLPHTVCSRVSSHWWSSRRVATTDLGVGGNGYGSGILLPGPLGCGSRDQNWWVCAMGSRSRDSLLCILMEMHEVKSEQY